jgi:hypothetical protein
VLPQHGDPPHERSPFPVTPPHPRHPLPLPALGTSPARHPSPNLAKISVTYMAGSANRMQRRDPLAALMYPQIYSTDVDVVCCTILDKADLEHWKSPASPAAPLLRARMHQRRGSRSGCVGIPVLYATRVHRDAETPCARGVWGLWMSSFRPHGVKRRTHWRPVGGRGVPLRGIVPWLA